MVKRTGRAKPLTTKAGVTKTKKKVEKFYMN